MGFNIIGVVLNKKVEDPITFAQEIGLGKIELLDEEAMWEDAMFSYNMDDQDVFFTDGVKGTLITYGTGIDWFKLDLRSATLKYDVQGVIFVISDTVGMYSIAVFANGKCVRYLNYDEGEIKIDKGSKLEIEEDKTIGSDMIIDIISLLIGTSFWDMEEDYPSVMYRRALI